MNAHLSGGPKTIFLFFEKSGFFNRRNRQEIVLLEQQENMVGIRHILNYSLFLTSGIRENTSSARDGRVGVFLFT